MDIAEPRKVKGLGDVAMELGEWWGNPTGKVEEASGDEEKALLKGHY
jgi:hypothetical protein